MKDEDVKKEFEEWKKNITEEDIKKALEREDEIKAKFNKWALPGSPPDIQLMFSLLKDYWNGAYREVPWTTIASIVVHLLWLPVRGPIKYVTLPLFLTSIHGDLEKYKQFKENKEYLKNQKIEEL